MAIGGAAGRAHIALRAPRGEVPSRALSAFGALEDSREDFLLDWLRRKAAQTFSAHGDSTEGEAQVPQKGVPCGPICIRGYLLSRRALHGTSMRRCRCVFRRLCWRAALAIARACFGNGRKVCRGGDGICMGLFVHYSVTVFLLLLVCAVVSARVLSVLHFLVNVFDS